MASLIIIVFVVISILVLSVFFIKNIFVTDKPNMEYQPQVKSLIYEVSGDEYGRSETYVLKDFVVEHEIDGGTIGDSSSKKSDFLIDDYNDLDQIIDSYNLKKWTNLDKSDLQILDGNTTKFIIEFNDGTIINLGYGYQMDSQKWSAIKDIIDLLENVLSVKK